MRMRKKKNLEERLASCGEILFTSHIEDRNFKTAIKQKEYIDFEAWFGKLGRFLKQYSSPMRY